MSPMCFRGIRKYLYCMGLSASFVMLSLVSAAADTRDAEWELQQRVADPESGFELYQRDVEDSGYDRYRLEAVVNASFERVIRAVQVRRTDDQYLGEGLTRRFLYRDGEVSISYIQMRIAMVKDRDVALRSHWGLDEENGVYRDEWMTANDHAPPVQNGFVRMKKSEGFWELTALDGNRTRVVYESHADPGGYVPGWIANRIFGNQIVGQIVTLRKILADQRTAVAGSSSAEAVSFPN